MCGLCCSSNGCGWIWYKIRGTTGVFTAELSVLFTALRHIDEVIRPPKRCLILTDSLSSIRAMLSRKIAHQTHSLMNECKQMCWSLCQNRIEVKLMDWWELNLIWCCERFRMERHRLIDALAVLNVGIGIPIRDLCGLKKWCAVKCCLDFLRGFEIKLWWLDPSPVFEGLEMYSLGP
jgi:hypothetical protein